MFGTAHEYLMIAELGESCLSGDRGIALVPITGAQPCAAETYCPASSWLVDRPYVLTDGAHGELLTCADLQAHSHLPPKPSRAAPLPPRTLSAQPPRSGPANLGPVSLPVSAGSLPAQITAPTLYPASPPRASGLPPDDYDKILNEVGALRVKG